MKKNKKLVPKRRFKEFENDGEWEQHKLKDVVRFSKGRGYAKKDLAESGMPIILYGRLYTKFETVINEVDTFAKAKENTVYSTGTEVIVPSSGETAEDIARAAAVRKEGVILGGDLNIMHLVESKDPIFLALSISNGTRKKELVKRAQGSSVVHLYNTDLEEAEVFFPKIEEQKKISSFFNHNDNLINLQKNKIEKSKKLKESYLSDMFPKEGEKYPRKRFEGFTEPWRKIKLGEITNSYSGGTPSAGKKDYYTGNIPFIRSGEIHGHTTKLFINELAISESSAKMVKKGDVLYALYGATSGEVAVSKINGAINQAVLAVIPNNGYDSNFLVQSLKKEKENILNKYLQGGQGNLSGSIIKSIELKIPSKAEQNKISRLFSNLDNQINLEEQKLNKLEQLKQAYLNELFV